MGSSVAAGGTESLLKSCLHLLDDLRLVSNSILGLASSTPGTHSISFLSTLEQREFLCLCYGCHMASVCALIP